MCFLMTVLFASMVATRLTSCSKADMRVLEPNTQQNPARLLTHPGVTRPCLQTYDATTSLLIDVCMPERKTER